MAEYVLAGYGTGAIMAVPTTMSGITPLHRNSAWTSFRWWTRVHRMPVWKKVGVMQNSGFLDGMEVKEAIARSSER